MCLEGGPPLCARSPPRLDQAVFTGPGQGQKGFLLTLRSPWNSSSLNPGPV